MLHVLARLIRLALFDVHGIANLSVQQQHPVKHPHPHQFVAAFGLKCVLANELVNRLVGSAFHTTPMHRRSRRWLSNWAIMIALRIGLFWSR